MVVGAFFGTTLLWDGGGIGVCIEESTLYGKRERLQHKMSSDGEDGERGTMEENHCGPVDIHRWKRLQE